jgi:toxin ParE1/3/4
MTVEIFLTASAEDDLQALYDYRLAKRGADGEDGADALLDQIYDAIKSLADFPNKGPIPQELDAVGIAEWRQLSVARYRIIYTHQENCVTVSIIADARQDFATLLERRVLRGVLR